MYAARIAVPRFKDEVLAQFVSQENINYLKHVVPNITDRSVIRYVHIAEELINFDPHAILRRNTDLWKEIRKINRHFIAHYINLQKSERSLTIPKYSASGDEIYRDENESYSMNMFTADSLRPNGMEHFNDSGPLHELNEDQVKIDNSVYFNAAEPEYVVAEQFRKKRNGGVEASYGNKASLEKNKGSGGRIMRYKSIPFWQKGGRGGIDYDLEEENSRGGNLGMGSRELESHVRKWDTSRY